MPNPFSLEGKTILVTGASSGMGRAVAIQCANLGAQIVLNGRNKTALQETLNQLQGEGHSIIASDISGTESIVQALSDRPKIDGIANCAGIAYMAPFAFMETEKVQQVMDINFLAPVRLIQTLLNAKKLNKPASIVFVSSVDGPKVVHAGNSIYSASKNALVGMARNMAIDLVGKKIRVNCVLPGTTNTPMIHTENVTDEMLDETAKKLPMKRFAEPEEVANAVVFLLSEAASYITGTEITVDGGSSIV